MSGGMLAYGFDPWALFVLASQICVSFSPTVPKRAARFCGDTGLLCRYLAIRIHMNQYSVVLVPTYINRQGCVKGFNAFKCLFSYVKHFE